MMEPKKEIHFQDQAFADIAVLFSSDTEQPTFRSDLLNARVLDYSVASLSLVDNYLDTIRNHSELKKDFTRTVLRTGAYVGEVLRRNGNTKDWHWIDFETAKFVDPCGWKTFEKTISCCAVLYRGGKSFCFPLGKVAKFLENGREDSVQSFVKVILDIWKKEDAEQRG